MRVQTVEWNSMYHGPQRQVMCQKHSGITQQAQSDNARYNYASYPFKAHGDWHEGECESVDYITPAEVMHGARTAVCY